MQIAVEKVLVQLPQNVILLDSYLDVTDTKMRSYTTFQPYLYIYIHTPEGDEEKEGGGRERRREEGGKEGERYIDKDRES